MTAKIDKKKPRGDGAGTTESDGESLQSDYSTSAGKNNKNFLIVDQAVIRDFYAQIPKLVDEAHLSVYAFRLYCHLKQVTGEGGMSWQSTRVLGEICNMSPKSIVKAKKELEEKELIVITEITGQPGRAFHKITLIDIWAENHRKYANTDKVSVGNFEVSTGNFEVSVGALKNNPIKNNPIKNNPLQQPPAELESDSGESLSLSSFDQEDKKSLYLQEIKAIWNQDPTEDQVTAYAQLRDKFSGEIVKSFMDWAFNKSQLTLSAALKIAPGKLANWELPRQREDAFTAAIKKRRNGNGAQAENNQAEAVPVAIAAQPSKHNGASRPEGGTVTPLPGGRYRVDYSNGAFSKIDQERNFTHFDKSGDEITDPAICELFKVQALAIIGELQPCAN